MMMAPALSWVALSVPDAAAPVTVIVIVSLSDVLPESVTDAVMV
jgi:hypothetical protein